MTAEEDAQRRTGGPNTEYEDTEAHDRIGFRQDDQTEYGSDSIDYGYANNAMDPSTKVTKPKH